MLNETFSVIFKHREEVETLYVASPQRPPWPPRSFEAVFRKCGFDIYRRRPRKSRRVFDILKFELMTAISVTNKKIMNPVLKKCQVA